MTAEKPAELIKSIPIWKGEYRFERLSGGLTNANYLLKDESGEYVVRLGNDIVEHQVMRFNELAASKAAHAAGLSPRVVYSMPGILVLDFVRSRPLGEIDVQVQDTLSRIVPLIRQCHHDLPEFLRGAALIFWVFHVIRDYAWTLREANSPHVPKLTGLLTASKRLEKAAGPFDIVFGHNDLLAANILDDGERLWLIDWDYAGFNSPLFDLGGLASNNGLSTDQEKWLLENYFEKPLDDELWLRFQAMKCASLLRETLWSMVSEIHSKIDFDYAKYSAQNLSKFEQNFGEFTQIDQ